MHTTWILRWDTRYEEQPLLTSPSGFIDQNGYAQFAELASGKDNAGEGFVAFEGYLFDTVSFSNDPHSSQAACIARSYQHYGEELFGELRGGFCLAVWDQTRSCLVAGRDAMGLQPLYYFWDGSLFLLSPDIDHILSQPEISGKVNRLMLSAYLIDNWNTYQRFETFFENVQRVPAAHQLRLINCRLELWRYWDPLPPGFQWASQDELETTPVVLERAVANCLQVGADSLALSGGFDSVSIAVLAAEQLEGKRPLHAVSLHNTIAEVNEGETQRAVAQVLGMPLVIRTIDECLNGVPFVGASLALSKTSPLPVLSPWQAMYQGLLEAAASLGLSKLILGTGGDEMFTVDLAHGADRLAALDLAGLWRYYQVMRRTSSFSASRVARVIFWDEAFKPEFFRLVRSVLERYAPALTQRLRRYHLAAPAWIAPGDSVLRATIEEWRLKPFQESSDPSEGSYVHKLRGLVQSPLLMAEVEQGSCWALHTNFTLLYPFYDRDVVALALRIHPEYLISGGYAKTPLRNLVAERLPGVVMPVKKVDFTSMAHVFLRFQGQQAWQDLGGLQYLADLGMVDPARLTPLVEAYFNGQNNDWKRAWLVLSAETWLRARG